MQVAAAEAYRIWSATYDAAPNPLLELESAALPGHLGVLTGKRFVDLGCGTGRWLEFADSRGARVMGFDACHEMLVQAKARPRLSGKLVRADAAQLPLAAAVSDVVLCSFAIAYLPSLDMAAAEIARIAAPGARILITDLHPAALRAGWTRSFRQGENVYDLEHTRYAEEDLIAAFSRAGLSLRRDLTLYFDERQRETFRRAGKERAFEDACRVPAVWMTVWTKA